MGNLILIALGVLLVFFILKMIFKAFKTIFYIAVIVVVGALALHFFAPETVDEWIGKDNHDKITGIVKEKTDSLAEKGKETAKDIADDVSDKLDSLADSN